MTDRLGTIGTQYSDNAGNPLVNGKLFIYISGTTTPKTTYADINLTIQNTNPVILTGDGRQPNVFFSGSAKIILTSSDETQIEVRDPIGVGTGGAFELWLNGKIYNKNSLVEGSDGNFYKSLLGNNRGNDPVTDISTWTRTQFNDTWNTNDIYSIDDIVQGSDGGLYKSKINSNAGNDPVSDSVSWSPAAGGVNVFEEFLTSGTFTKDPAATFIKIEAIGGGGSGSTKDSTYFGGGGGGVFVTHTIFASHVNFSVPVAVTVGAGGVHSGTGPGVIGGASEVLTADSLRAAGGNPGPSGTVRAYAQVPDSVFQGSQPRKIEGTTAELLRTRHFNASAGAGGNQDTAGQYTLYGGGGGGTGAVAVKSAGGNSIFGGNGGNGASGAASDGAVPGGGGGASSTNTAGFAGNGADGRVRIWQW